MQLGKNLIEISENTFKAEFDQPFIPPSRLEEKEKYDVFKGTITVEPSRLFTLYEILKDTLQGKFLDKPFFLKGDTSGDRIIIITPPNLISDSARKKGAIYGFKFEHRKNNKIYTGRAIFSLTLLSVLKNEIKTKGKIQLQFIDIDEEERAHIIIMERSQNKVKVIYPVELELSETKRSKLEIALNLYKQNADKVPTTIVGSKVVFRRNQKGDFVIHTPHHSVRLKPEDIDRLLLLIQS